jgi:serine/threonine-protein kinase RsbW
MTDTIRSSPCSLELPARLADLEYIRKFIETCAEELVLPPTTTYDVNLAVTELVTNTLLYGYTEQSGWVRLELEAMPGSLAVRIQDHAREFDPTQVGPPDLSLPLEKRSLGGMGIHLIRQITQQMQYRRLPTGGNEIVLIFSTGG